MANGSERDNLRVDDLPTDLGQPARHALALAGYERLEQFVEVTAAEILQLHGVGPKAIRLIERDLALRGQTFAKKKP